MILFYQLQNDRMAVVGPDHFKLSISAQPGSTIAGCLGLQVVRLCVSPRMETPQVPFIGFEIRSYFSKDCFHVYDLRNICTSTAERAFNCNRKRKSVKKRVASRQELLKLALSPRCYLATLWI